MTSREQSDPLAIGGMRIIASPLVDEHTYRGPVLLDAGIKKHVGARFFAEFNDWLIATFGGEKTAPFLVMPEEGAIYCHPANAAALREALARTGAPA